MTRLAIAALLLFCREPARASDWQIDMVDQIGAGKFSSLQIDRDGNAHLAYVAENSTHPLRYAFWDHALKRWFVMTVAEHASFTSMVLDSKQRPQISWADFGSMVGCKLRYARWDGTKWLKQAVPLAADTVAYYTSIALDAQDAPSISFYELDGPPGSGFRVRMRVVTFAGNHWEVQTVDGQNQSGKFNALAMDPKGILHLAYANVNALTAGARYAYRSDGVWHVEVVDDLSQGLQYYGHGLCIALDKQGGPHISYLNSSNPAVKYAFRKGGKWVVEVVEQLAGVDYPDRNSITLDDNGQAYISYYDSGRGVLRMAHRQGMKWITESVDGGRAGFTSSIQIHGETIWIAYADEQSNGLKVARRSIAPAPAEAGDASEAKFRH